MPCTQLWHHNELLAQTIEAIANKLRALPHTPETITPITYTIPTLLAQTIEATKLRALPPHTP